MSGLRITHGLIIRTHFSGVFYRGFSTTQRKRADEDGPYVTREQLSNERIQFRRSLAMLDKDIAAINSQLGCVKVLVDTTEQVNNYIKWFEIKVEGAIKELESRVEGSIKDLERKVGVRFNKVSEGLSEVDASFVKVGLRFDGVDVGFEKVEKQLADLNVAQKKIVRMILTGACLLPVPVGLLAKLGYDEHKEKI